MIERNVGGRIIGHVQKYYGDLASVSVDGDTTIDALGLDSLDKTELVIHVEREFDITIHDEEWETCDTVGKLIVAVNDAIARRTK